MLCVSLCGCPPDDYFESVEYESEISNLVRIDGDKTSFIQGDTLFLTIDIPKNIITTNGEKIDLQDDLGSSLSYFTLKLSRKGDFANPAVLSLTENEFVLVYGDVYLNDYDKTRINCTMVFNGESFVFRYGIWLKEQGDFILSQYDQTSNDWIFYFEDNKVENDIHQTVIVKSKFPNNSNTVGFEFKVE